MAIKINTTDQAAPELLPCPFCGGNNVRVFGPVGWYRQFGISHSCQAFHGGSGDFTVGAHSREEAISAWNRRADLAAPSALDEVEGLVERLKDAAKSKHIAMMWPCVSESITALTARQAEIERLRLEVEQAWTERNRAQSKVDAWNSVVVASTLPIRVAPGTGWGPGGNDEVSVPHVTTERLTGILDLLAAQQATIARLTAKLTETREREALERRKVQGLMERLTEARADAAAYHDAYDGEKEGRSKDVAAAYERAAEACADYPRVAPDETEWPHYDDQIAHSQALIRALATEPGATALAEREKQAFNFGYMLACCNVANMHNDEPVASDVLAEAGITEANVAAMNLSEYDAEALIRIRSARSHDPILARLDQHKEGGA